MHTFKVNVIILLTSTIFELTNVVLQQSIEPRINLVLHFSVIPALSDLVSKRSWETIVYVN